MIGIVIPVLNRPNKLKKLLESYIQTTDNCSKLFIGVDYNDPTVNDYIEVVNSFNNDNFSIMVLTEHTKTVPKTNFLVSLIVDKFDYVGFLGEDVVFKTDKWDRHILDSFKNGKDYTIVYCNDKHQMEKMPTHPFLTSKLIKKLGWFFMPSLYHTRCDAVLREIGMKLNLISNGNFFYLSDVIIEHQHPDANKSDYDNVYKKAYSVEWRAHDVANYNAYMQHQFKADLLKLMEVSVAEKTFDSTLPIVNIITRTSGRPIYFSHCYESIHKQTYPNINHIVTYDNDETLEYLKKYSNITTVPVQYVDPIKIPAGKYRVAPWNLYVNKALSVCKPGLVMYVDDDDKLLLNDSVQLLVNSATDENALYFWKVQFPNTTIPNELHWDKLKKGEAPQQGQISTLGFAHYLQHSEEWDVYAFGDYTVCSKLWNKLKTRIFIDGVLSGIQRQIAGGHGQKDDLKTLDIKQMYPASHKMRIAPPNHK